MRILIRKENAKLEKLFKKLSKLTSSSIVDRGIRYFNKKKAKLTTLIKTGDKITLESRVAGSYGNSYYVDIIYFTGNRKQDESIVYECDCPNFSDTGKPCKHIIASGIAADKEIEAGNIYFKENREFKREEEEENIDSYIAISEDEEYDEIFKKDKKSFWKKEKNIYKQIEKEEINEFRKKLMELKNRFDKNEIPDSEKNEYRLELEISQIVPTLSALRVKAGEKSLHYVKDLESFISSIGKKESYEVTPRNIYNPDLHYFNETDKRIIKNLDDYFKNKQGFGMHFNSYYGKMQGEPMNPLLAEQIFLAVENRKTIRSEGKTLYVTGEYEPIFAFQKDKRGREKIILRDFIVLSSTSRYFSLRNGISNIEKFHKMSDVEWKIMNTLTDGTRSGTEYLNEISGKLVNEIKEVLSKYEMPVAGITDE